MVLTIVVGIVGIGLGCGIISVFFLVKERRETKARLKIRDRNVKLQQEQLLRSIAYKKRET
jgi:hypothetical protein